MNATRRRLTNGRRYDVHSFDPHIHLRSSRTPTTTFCFKIRQSISSRNKLTLGEHVFDLSVTRTSQGRMAIRSLALVGNFGPPISSPTPPMLVSCSRCFRIFSFFPLGSTSSASLDVHSEPLPYYCTKKCRRYSTATNTMLPSVARQPQVAHLQVALMVKTPESGMVPRFSSLLDMPWYNHNPSKTCRLSVAACTTSHLTSVSHAGAALLRLTYFTTVTNTSLKVPTI